jgi:hypothetical protein
MTRKIEIAPGVSVVLIEDQNDDAPCEQCGKIDELRPYGRQLENGRRLNVCFDCGMSDRPSTDAAIKELFD